VDQLVCVEIEHFDCRILLGSEEQTVTRKIHGEVVEVTLLRPGRGMA
jgi:hypothetical protein